MPRKISIPFGIDQTRQRVRACIDVRDAALDRVEDAIQCANECERKLLHAREAYAVDILVEQCGTDVDLYLSDSDNRVTTATLLRVNETEAEVFLDGIHRTVPLAAIRKVGPAWREWQRLK